MIGLVLVNRVQEGQGLCPWTPLGPEAPDPYFSEGKAKGGTAGPGRLALVGVWGQSPQVFFTRLPCEPSTR